MAKVSQLENYMEFSRGKNFITHQTEADAESEFFGLIEVIDRRERFGRNPHTR
jgi:hypothetical protein